jgi:hypothetical protein
VSLGAVSYDWAAGNPALRMAGGSSQLGCGVVTEGQRGVAPRDGHPADVRAPDDYCYRWQTRWPQVAAQGDVRLAVVLGGVWETADWQLAGTERWTSLTDRTFADLVHAKLTEATGILAADGRHALLATTPLIGPGRSGNVAAERGLAADYPQRVDIYNQLVRAVADADDRVDVVEFGAYIDSLDLVTNVDWLPDGIHPTASAALAIWEQFLGPAVTQALPPPQPTLLTSPRDPEQPDELPAAPASEPVPAPNEDRDPTHS